MGNCLKKITAWRIRSYFTLLSQLVVVATPEIVRKPQVVFLHRIFGGFHHTPGTPQPLANRDPGIHLLRVCLGSTSGDWNFELLPAFFFGKKLDPPKFVVFFWTRELEKKPGESPGFVFLKIGKNFWKFQGFTESFIHFLFWSVLSIGHGTAIVTSRI